MSLITRTGVVMSPRYRAVNPDTSMDAVACDLRRMGARVTRGERSVNFDTGQPGLIRGQLLAGISGGEMRWETAGNRVVVRYTVTAGVLALAPAFIGGTLLLAFFVSLLFGEPSLFLGVLGAAGVPIGLHSMRGTEHFEAWLQRTASAPDEPPGFVPGLLR